MANGTFGNGQPDPMGLDNQLSPLQEEGFKAIKGIVGDMRKSASAQIDQGAADPSEVIKNLVGMFGLQSQAQPNFADKFGGGMMAAGMALQGQDPSSTLKNLRGSANDPNTILQRMIGNIALGNNLAPVGYEIMGYDQKGNPMIRKTQPNVPAQKFEAEQEEKKALQEKQTQTIRDTATDTLNTIAEVEKGIKYFGWTGDYPTLPIHPEYAERKNWEVNVDKLLSGKVLEIIQTMKEGSKTGATGFGQLSEKEGEILKSASTQLKKSLTPEKAKPYLDQMKEKLTKVLSKTGQESGGEQVFNVGGKNYRVPVDKVEAFKKAKGL